jgi:hypothetical protein
MIAITHPPHAVIPAVSRRESNEGGAGLDSGQKTAGMTGETSLPQAGPAGWSLS